jgi:YCII-related domain-containing protein
MKYLLLYKGPATQPDTSHAAWPDWFNRIGDALVDVGSPMQNGQSVRADGSARESAAGLNGYSIVEAPDMDAARALLENHPLFEAGDDYTVEIYEVPRK